MLRPKASMLVRSAPGMPRLAVPAVVVPLMIVLFAPRTHAADPCEPVAARIVSLQGRVEVQAAGSAEWTVAALEDGLCIGDTLRVSGLSRAALALPDNPTLRLDQLTTLRLLGTTESGSSWLDLLLGAVHSFSRLPHALRIDTPVANAGTEGTEFLMRVAEGRAEVVMFEGRVRLTTPEGELLVASGDAAIALEGEAPTRQIVARPRDAVAWALYYPPILASLAERGAAPATLPPGLQRAIERVGANDYAGAIAALDEVPAAARDARYLTYRAGVLLNVGQVDGAEEALARALALEPAAGEALAQRAVLRVVQNRREEALADARRAVELSPDSAPARIALSYALQAVFELEAARATLREAVERSPDDALAWARLAELEQSFGALGAAQAAAERAVALAPGLARTQMVLGFAALTRIDIAQAKAAFERAIELDSAEPLARLGLGLARIRAGDLAAGGRDLEIAVALDPDDSLLRSYLGKAYFEERRGPLDAAQFAIAKELDPNDPTPWFYDAIRLQTENRPVEALRSLERSIALNDNRAPYRSRLLLDEDRATRGVSLARIYDDLGFEQLGLLEASKSLSQDPANSSAHRFLSDTYARLPRHEVARASELLQAQLLQPININPVQPSAPITDLNVISGAGPAEAAFNEYTPLFERNRAQLTATGFVGTNSSFGDELIVSTLWNKISFSVGQFHSQTDGFRQNNDVKNDVVNLFGQWSPNPRLGLQAEYRQRDTDQGDLELNFDGDSFRSLRDDISEKTLRIGGRFDISEQGRFIWSGSLVDSSDRSRIPEFFDIDLDIDHEGYQFEGAHIFDINRLSLITGVGFSRLNQDVRFSISNDPSDQSDDIASRYVFTYSKLRFPDPITWVVGATIEGYEEGSFNNDKINPKFGVLWEIHPSLTLRSAIVRTVARPQSANQTIEPTTIVGFNQFFDDFQGTDAWQYAIALDGRITDSIGAGVQYQIRDLNGPINNLGEDIEKIQQDEIAGKAYVYAIVDENWVVQTGVEYERFEQEPRATALKQKMDTWLVPVEVRFFDETGVFAWARATMVNQEVEMDRVNLGDEYFMVIDAAIGYRIPRRAGIMSLEVTNILDEGFRYQDVNFRTRETLNPRFVPERTILARLTLNF